MGVAMPMITHEMPASTAEVNLYFRRKLYRSSRDLSNEILGNPLWHFNDKNLKTCSWSVHYSNIKINNKIIKPQLHIFIDLDRQVKSISQTQKLGHRQ